MSKRRSRYVTNVGPIACSLLLVFAFHGIAGAATHTSEAAAGAAWRGNMLVRLKGTVTGPECVLVGRGRFTLSITISTYSGGIGRPGGQIADRGTFVDDDSPACHRGPYPHRRTLIGRRGTIRISVGEKGDWRIASATKMYALLRGRGIEYGSYSELERTIDITMTGRVSR